MLRACVRTLFAPKKHAPIRKRSTRLKLGIETLETRDLMAAGLAAALPEPLPTPADDAGQIAVLDSAMQVAQTTQQIDAAELQGDYLSLDYVAFNADEVHTDTLLPGQHFLMGLGGATLFFNVTDAGTIDYDPALEGILSGQGTTSLQIHGAAISIEAAELNGDYLSLDDTAFNADAPLETQLLPGRHFLMGMGGATLFFEVTEAGTIDYDPALEGILTGQGTSALQVHGAAVTIDAAELNGDYLSLDYTAFNADATLETQLLPGRHFLMGYGGATLFFNVTEAGTIDYDPALEGILTGQGTSAMQVHGVGISIDAAELNGDYLSLDYTAFNADATLETQVLPGRHFLMGYGGAVVFFDVSESGAIDYEANLDGALAGRGTNNLAVQGVHLTIDPSSLGAISYLSLDYTPYALDVPFEAYVLPGSHFLNRDSTISWFTVHEDGTVSGDEAAVNTVHVWSAIDEKYAALDNAADLLGDAVGSVQTLAEGGSYQQYLRGAIFSAPTVGTHVLAGAFFDQYQADGGVELLGLPTMDLTTLPDSSVQYVAFEKGAIVSSVTGLRTLFGDNWSTAITAESSILKYLKLQNSLPQLSSDPGAPATLYLNFMGDFRADWFEIQEDGAERHMKNINTPVFDYDNDATQFSAAEQQMIRNIFAMVVEDYAPFNINITTVQPQNMDRVLQVNIGGGFIDWMRYSGYASINSFTNYAPNVVYVFSDQIEVETGGNVVESFEKMVATTISHEAGHAFGLNHHHTYDPYVDYAVGTDEWTPIMGFNLATDRTTWGLGMIDRKPLVFNGTTFQIPIFQYDMDVIGRAENGFGFRADDYGNTFATATQLRSPLIGGGLLSAQGLIGSSTDVDAFSFTTAAGGVSIRLEVAALGANLDSRIELYRSNGTLVAAVDRTYELGAMLNTSLEAGKYFVLVKSHGGHGDVGRYTLDIAPVYKPFELDPNILDPNVSVGQRPSGDFWKYMVQNDRSIFDLDPIPEVDLNPIPVPPGPVERYTAPAVNFQTALARPLVQTRSSLDRAFLSDAWIPVLR